MTECLTLPLLPPELSIYTAAQTHSRFQTWLIDGTLPIAAPGSVAIDASHVDVVDGAGIQLLVSMSRTLAHLGIEMRLRDCPELLHAACEGLGVSHLTIGHAQ